jgi:hypothetical protein
MSDFGTASETRRCISKLFCRPPGSMGSIAETPLAWETPEPPGWRKKLRLNMERRSGPLRFAPWVLRKDLAVIMKHLSLGLAGP